jgi:hypothetical protein
MIIRPPTIIYWYVQYDATGKVHALSNVPSTVNRNFEIDRELVKEFMAFGTKKADNYAIEYFFNLSKGIIEKEEEQVIVQNNMPYLIPRTKSYNNEITIEHYTSEAKWRISVREDIKDKLEIASSFLFFVSKKDNPHILYTTIHVDTTKINEDIPFKTKVELNLSKFSLVTNKRFNSYGIKEIE